MGLSVGASIRADLRMTCQHTSRRTFHLAQGLRSSKWLSFAISETFLPAHKTGSVTGEDLWEYEFKEIDRNANCIHLVLHVDLHISHVLDWTCHNLPLSSSGKPDFNQKKRCWVWNQKLGSLLSDLNSLWPLAINSDPLSKKELWRHFKMQIWAWHLLD